MLRLSILRASSSSTSLLSSTATRQALRISKPSPLACISAGQQQQSRQAHAISNPTLAGIEKRWEAMPPQEQADLWMALRDRMKTDWHELTMAEKKAAYWIAFGPHGPRALPPPGEGWKIFWGTMVGISIAFGLLILVRSMAKPGAPTMNAEYQKQTEEYLKVRAIILFSQPGTWNLFSAYAQANHVSIRQSQNTEPISGISSEGYTGTMVQSAPKKRE
ncbi:MAG: Cytochrome c oxidase subunit 5A [Pycnora praestabilis]|nr:MAG: Cytochrome c oxidase subunit 5A [Pycnora praestabilis]